MASRSDRILPLRAVAFNYLGVWIPFKQVNPDSPQRVDAPLGIAHITKVCRKERPEVRGEYAIHYGIARLAHHPGLEREIVQRHS